MSNNLDDLNCQVQAVNLQQLVITIEFFLFIMISESIQWNLIMTKVEANIFISQILEAYLQLTDQLKKGGCGSKVRFGWLQEE